METPKYYGNYLGIVLQNNDPAYRGRVKVFVPHISPTVYQGWVDSLQDKKFKFIGENVASDLTSLLSELQIILPWAEVAAPLAGESGSGRFHRATGTATTSDSSKVSEIIPGSGELNIDGVGEKPGAIYDITSYRLSDAFSNPQLTNVNYVNKLAYEYVPEAYSNAAKGTFSVLNVGAHVWVFFQNGDPLKPVVFATSHGAADWTSIFDATSGQPGIDYPGKYENRLQVDSDDININTYRNKYVINQKGGVISFVNTDNREMLKMTHFSGSFKEFNNMANIELATNNDQKLVLGDSFLTIRGTRNEYSQRDYDNNIRGDYYKKIGNLRDDLHAKWKGIWADIADIKQLFHIRRTAGVKGVNKASSFFKLNSRRQRISGTPALCPVCSDGESLTFSVNTTFDPPGYKITSDPVTTTQEDNQTPGGPTINGTPQVYYQDMRPVVGPNGKKYAFRNEPGNIQLDQFGNVYVAQPGKILGVNNISNCPCCNGPNTTGQPRIIGFAPGKSASSFRGVWDKEELKDELPNKISAALPKLAKLEAQMGAGGSEIVEITKHKIETIGLVMNDFGSIRVDPIGKMEKATLKICEYGTTAVNLPSPLIEAVQVDDLPGGTYTLNVCNRYNILVGAGGVNLKTYGVINIAGAITNIAGEQVNIGSANEVNIDGGKRLSLCGDIINIRQRQGETVLVDSNLGVVGNLIIRGNLHVEGCSSFISMAYKEQRQLSDETDITAGGRQGVVTGSTITCDTGHVFNKKTGEAAIGLSPAKTPTYMGYTDRARATSLALERLFLGCVPNNIEFKLELPEPNFGWSAIGSKSTQTVTLKSPLPVRAEKNVFPGDISAATSGSNGIDVGEKILSLDDIKELPDIKDINDKDLDLVRALGGENKGCYIPGVGHGGGSVPRVLPPGGRWTEGKRNLPLRGLPAEGAQLMYNTSELDWEGQPASESPILTIGNGSSSSGTQCARTQIGYTAPSGPRDNTTTATRSRAAKLSSGDQGPCAFPGNDFKEQMAGEHFDSFRDINIPGADSGDPGEEPLSSWEEEATPGTPNQPYWNDELGAWDPLPPPNSDIDMGLVPDIVDVPVDSPVTPSDGFQETGPPDSGGGDAGLPIGDGTPGSTRGGIGGIVFLPPSTSNNTPGNSTGGISFETPPVPQ